MIYPIPFFDNCVVSSILRADQAFFLMIQIFVHVFLLLFFSFCFMEVFQKELVGLVHKFMLISSVYYLIISHINSCLHKILSADYLKGKFA